VRYATLVLVGSSVAPVRSHSVDTIALLPRPLLVMYTLGLLKSSQRIKQRFAEERCRGRACAWLPLPDGRTKPRKVPCCPKPTHALQANTGKRRRADKEIKDNCFLLVGL